MCRKVGKHRQKCPTENEIIPWEMSSAHNEKNFGGDWRRTDELGQYTAAQPKGVRTKLKQVTAEPRTVRGLKLQLTHGKLKAGALQDDIVEEEGREMKGFSRLQAGLLLCLRTAVDLASSKYRLIDRHKLSSEQYMARKLEQ
ncbi:hypothetical protein C8R44DRAFT_750562 [Mycena epipterygia]|nr:hypothetical protein C8R44DRAFT_750562 [Mycena epipterygia]